MHTQSTAPSKPAFLPRVRRLAPGRYLVESASHPGVGHPVTLDRCNCTGFSYRGSCRHVTLVRAIEPRMVTWYSQATAPATPAGSLVEKFPQATPASSMDHALAAAEQLLALKRRALADAHPQSDERAVLLHALDQAERAVAALGASAMRAA